jgi:hypothetical protein
MGAPYVPPSGAFACSARLLAAARDAAPALARLRTQSLPRVTQAEIIPFVQRVEPPAPVASPPGKLEEVALLYLRTPCPPNGLIKAMAVEHGLNYGSLLSKIDILRRTHRFA